MFALYMCLVPLMTFNSLFEMLEDGGREALHVASQLSILYLRCRPGQHPVALCVYGLSILYLRCWQKQTGEE